jgi:hypothetical protein
MSIFWSSDQAAIEEREKLFRDLIAKAIEGGEHSKFEYLTCTAEWWVAKACQRSLRKVIDFFDIVAAKLYVQYCVSVKKGTADFNMLYTYTQYKACQKFYTEELAIIEDMLDEYWAYVGAGHFIDQWILFRAREYYEFYDFRKAMFNGPK